MSYITVAQFATHYAANELRQVSDRNSDGVDDVGVLQSAIDRAAAEIDSYLAQCYPLPLQSAVAGAVIDGWVWTMLEEWNGRIARHYLWDDVRRNSDGNGIKGEPRQRYEETIKRMTGLAAGGCVLLGNSVLKTRDTQLTPVEPMVMIGDQGRHWGRGQFGLQRGNQGGECNVSWNRGL
jgi:phage gp36-like protein